MTFVVNSGPGGFHYIRLGYYNALKIMGYNTYYLNPEDNNYITNLINIKPTYIIGSTWEINSDVLTIMKKLNIKGILRASEWLQNKKEIDAPLCFVNNLEKEICKELFENELIHFVHSYYPQIYIDKMLYGWKKEIGLEIKSSLLAADDTVYFPTARYNHLQHDLSFIGGWWPYKSPNLQIIVNVFKKFNSIIFGYGNWPSTQHKGQIDDGYVKFILTNSKICPNVMEPFAVKYGFDVNERSYKTMACGVMSIIQENKAAKEIFEDNIEYFSTEEELLDKINFYLSNDMRRNELAEKGYNFVQKKHTYINRIKEFMSWIDNE